MTMSIDTARFEREQAERELQDELAPAADPVGAEIARRMAAGDRTSWRFSINGGPAVSYDEAVEQFREALPKGES